MGVFLYNIFLILARAGFRLAAPFNSKAKLWLKGREQLLPKMAATILTDRPVIWMHCASLGEFEQGRPVLEKLRQQYPHYRALITFFSPSGYEVRKDYPGADWVFYLPLDGRRNAEKFLNLARPAIAIFVKYEYWYYYLTLLKERGIPTLLVSAIFRPSSPFFQWYGSLHRKMLTCFTQLFVQDEISKNLLGRIGMSERTIVAGDTRFDRVVEIAGSFEDLPLLKIFLGQSDCLVAGSTWPEDERMLSHLLNLEIPDTLKLVIAPHELGSAHLAELANLFPGSLLYSEMQYAPAASSARVLILDTMGMLANIYRFGKITYVGGGLKTTGVHNVLEAAVHSRPVVTGPYFSEYLEAVELHGAGGAFVIRNEVELASLINRLLNDEKGIYAHSSSAAGQYVRSKTGATRKVLNYVQENRLLIN